MIPINNSDTAWLIVSDYLQDNGKYFDELRDDIDSPETNDWISCILAVSFQSDSVGGSLVGFGTVIGPSVSGVGSASSLGGVGEYFNSEVGGGYPTAGSSKNFEDDYYHGPDQ